MPCRFRRPCRARCQPQGRGPIPVVIAGLDSQVSARRNVRERDSASTATAASSPEQPRGRDCCIRRNPAARPPSSDTCSGFVRSISVATPTSALCADREHAGGRARPTPSRRATGAPQPARCGEDGERDQKTCRGIEAGPRIGLAPTGSAYPCRVRAGDSDRSATARDAPTTRRAFDAGRDRPDRRATARGECRSTGRGRRPQPAG